MWLPALMFYVLTFHGWKTVAVIRWKTCRRVTLCGHVKNEEASSFSVKTFISIDFSTTTCSCAHKLKRRDEIFFLNRQRWEESFGVQNGGYQWSYSLLLRPNRNVMHFPEYIADFLYFRQLYRMSLSYPQHPALPQHPPKKRTFLSGQLG